MARPSLLLALLAAGNPQAVARRMGVDCGYWTAGMSEFSKSSVCDSKLTSVWR